MNTHLDNIKSKLKDELSFDNDIKSILDYAAISCGISKPETMTIDEILSSIHPELEVTLVQYFWTRYGHLEL